jgi:hypothetical protein
MLSTVWRTIRVAQQDHKHVLTKLIKKSSIAAFLNAGKALQVKDGKYMARIYQTASMGEASIRVALVHARGMADLLVHRVSTMGLARGDALWYITRDRQMAATTVFFTSPGMAEVNIFFVDNYGEAGWQKPHRCQGRFSR